MTFNNRKKIISVTVAALISLPAAVFYTNYAISNQTAPEQDEQVVNIPKVSTVNVTSKQYSSNFELLGEVSAVDQIQLSSEVSGKVIWRNPRFAIGGRINAGEELIHIDPISYQVALANAKQALAQANLTLKQEKRQKAQALKDWKRSGLKAKPSSLLLREPQLAVAYASYHSAKATLEQAKRDLAQTKIVAPFDAIVLERPVGLGSYLQQGSATATLRASSSAEISLPLQTAQWSQLPYNPVGLKVELTQDDQPGVKWQGSVQRLSQNINSETRLRNLIVVVHNPLDQPSPLLFGSFVRAKVTGRPVNDLLAIPSTALTPQGYLWFVKDNKLQRTKRQPLFNNGATVYIAAKELKNSVQVVRKPLSSYLPGMQVIPSDNSIARNSL